MQDFTYIMCWIGGALVRKFLYAPPAQPEANSHSQPGPAWPVICWVFSTGPTVSTSPFHTRPFPPFPANLPLAALHPLLTSLSAAVTAAGCWYSALPHAAQADTEAGTTTPARALRAAESPREGSRPNGRTRRQEP